MRRHRIREVAGGRAADGIEPERGGRVDPGGHDAVLEGQRRMGHRVVLDPHPRYAEAPCEGRGVDQRREPRVERPHRVAVERQPLLVAPQRGRPAGDRLAVRQRASRLIHGVERPETLLADGGRGGGALEPAAAAAQRSGGERRSSDGSRHVSLNKKTRATTAAGGRFLAPCLTWRQYAANHHESSIVLTNNSRGPWDVKSSGTTSHATRPEPGPARRRACGSPRAPARAPPAPWRSTTAGALPHPARTRFPRARRCGARRATARRTTCT